MKKRKWKSPPSVSCYCSHWQHLGRVNTRRVTEAERQQPKSSKGHSVTSRWEMWKSQSGVTLCNSMDHTFHWILQARILEWVAIPFSRRSSQSRDQSQISHIAGRFFTSWATRECLVAKVKKKTTKNQTQILVGRVWIYYDSLRPPKWLYFCLSQSSQGIKYFWRSETVVWGVVKGRWMMHIDIWCLLGERIKGQVLTYLFFILLQQKTRCNLPKE